jgi:hypothetical protein
MQVVPAPVWTQTRALAAGEYETNAAHRSSATEAPRVTALSKLS